MASSTNKPKYRCPSSVGCTHHCYHSADHDYIQPCSEPCIGGEFETTKCKPIKGNKDVNAAK